MTVSISVERAGPFQVVAASGCVDHEAATVLAERLAANVDGLPSLLDLRYVRLTDGNEMGALVTLLEHSAATGGLRGVVCQRLTVRILLRRAGLSRGMPLFRSVTTALENLSGPSVAEG